MVILCDGSIVLPFPGVDERDPVAGIHPPGQGETVFLGHLVAAPGLRFLDLQRGLRNGGGILCVLRQRKHVRAAFGIDLGDGHPVEFIQLEFLDVLDQLDGIGRVGGIAGLLEAVRPALVVRRLQVEQELVAVAVAEEVGMVPERGFGVVIGPETLVLRIVVGVDGAALPIVVALDAEMVVAVLGQRGTACAGLQEPLRQGDAGRHAGAVHLSDGNAAVLGNICILGRLRVPGGKEQGRCGRCHQYEHSLHKKTRGVL